MSTYTTSNGNTYEFSFERQSDASIRVYIDRQPSYGSRHTDPHNIHRNSEGGRYYICWDTPLYSLSDAKEVAAGWAKRTDRYIRSGVPFERPDSPRAYAMSF
jgi:hypothetical protein